MLAALEGLGMCTGEDLLEAVLRLHLSAQGGSAEGDGEGPLQEKRRHQKGHRQIPIMLAAH